MPLFIIFGNLCIGTVVLAQPYGDDINYTNIIYTKTTAIARKITTDKKQQPLMYPNPRNGYRTGYARPKTRFAHPNKRFSQPQTRFAHKRPDYIYTKEYQNNVQRDKVPSTKKENNL